MFLFRFLSSCEISALLSTTQRGRERETDRERERERERERKEEKRGKKRERERREREERREERKEEKRERERERERGKKRRGAPIAFVAFGVINSLSLFFLPLSLSLPFPPPLQKIRLFL